MNRSARIAGIGTVAALSIAVAAYALLAEIVLARGGSGPKGFSGTLPP